MLKAVVSGRAAAAVVIDGHHWYRIDAGQLDELKPSGPHEWSYVFGISDDLQYLRAPSYDEIRRVLTVAVDHDHALALSLIVLDIETTSETRKLAADDFQEIMERTPAAVDFVWRILSSKPLPSTASMPSALAVTTGEAQHLFERLEKYQPAITRVRDAWETIPRALYSGMNNDEIFAFFAHAGICAAYAEAVDDVREIEIPKNVVVPEQWRAADIQRILAKWAESATREPWTLHHAKDVVVEQLAATIPPPAEKRLWTFFGAADPDLEFLQSPIDFHGSLLNNILLHHGIWILDSYLIESEGVREHLNRPQSLLEAGTAAGLINYAYEGTKLKWWHPHERLQAAHLRAGRDVLHLLPRRVSDVISERHLALLEATDLPLTIQKMGGISSLIAHWEATIEWRRDVINEAREDCLRRGQPGVDKQTLFRALVRIVLHRSPEEVPSIAHLPDDIDPELKEQVRTFWSWVAEGYRFSQASDLGALVYSPGYDRLQNLFVTVALSSIGGARPVSINVKMPSTEDLKLVPPDDIIGLRLGPGKAYLNAVTQLHASPEQRKPVERAIEGYMEEIGRVTALHSKNKEVNFKRVEMTVGLPAKRRDDDSESAPTQFASMTTFDSLPGKIVRQLSPRARVGPVITNRRTDVVVDDF